MSACMQTVYFSYFFVDRPTLARPVCVAWALVLNDAYKGWGTTVRCNAHRAFPVFGSGIQKLSNTNVVSAVSCRSIHVFKNRRRKLQRILLCKDIFDESSEPASFKSYLFELCLCPIN